jgi:hypothetical protein
VALTVLTDNGVFQTGLALVLLLVSLIYQLLHSPFRNPSANRLEAISTSALILVLFVGMVGSIGELDMQIMANVLEKTGFALVLGTTLYATVLVVTEVAEASRIRSQASFGKGRSVNLFDKMIIVEVHVKS